MGLVIGTNCGFVTTAPTTTETPPSQATIDGRSQAAIFTVPANAVTVTGFGMMKNTGTVASACEMALYNDDSDGTQPGSLFGTVATGVNSTTTALEWIAFTGLSINVSSKQGSSLWIAAVMTAHTGSSTIGVSNIGIVAAYRTGINTLPDPWGTKTGSVSAGYIYALYTTGGGAVASKIPQMMANYRRRRS